MITTGFTFSQPRSQLDTQKPPDEVKNYVYDANINNYIYVSSRGSVKYDAQGAPIPGTGSPVQFTSDASVTQNGIFRLALSSVELWYDTPNVNARNQTFVVTILGNSQTITVPTGYYTSYSSMATALQTAMRVPGGAFAGINVTVNALTNQFEVENAAAFTITATNKHTGIFGFFPGTKDAVFGGGVYTYVTKAATLLYTRYVDITSTALTKYNKSDQSANEIQRANTLVRARFLSSIGTEGPGPIGFGTPEPKLIKFSQNTDVGYIDITLYDEFGDVLFYDDALQNFYISLELLVYNDPRVF